jgi:hypothetical protein
MVLTPIITAIMTGLATAGFLNLSSKDNADGTTSILDGQGQNIVTVNPQTEVFTNEIPLKSAKTQLNRVSSTALVKGAANVKIVNLIQNNRIYHVSVIPDASFKTLGNLIIRVGNSDILTIDAADLTDTDALSIPLPPEGLSLDAGDNIEVFIWSLDGTAVVATVMILTGVKN